MPCLGELLALLSTVLAAAEVADCHSAPAVRYEPRSFLGYACEDDCQRHKAGFAWAERHRVTDVAACVHLESAATEGCQAFAQLSLTPEQAGYRWALENEIVDPCLCEGAGERFRAGCRHQLLGAASQEIPTGTLVSATSLGRGPDPDCGVKTMPAAPVGLRAGRGAWNVARRDPRSLDRLERLQRRRVTR